MEPMWKPLWKRLHPRLKEGQVRVDADGTRWRVMRVTATAATLRALAVGDGEEVFIRAKVDGLGRVLSKERRFTPALKSRVEHVSPYAAMELEQ